jgi:AraC-like DNA-binding protein
MFTRQTPGKREDIALPADRCGLYIDPRPASYKVDSIRGEVRVRVRYLEQAVPGKWSIRGFAQSQSEVSSCLFYDTLRLQKAGTSHPSSRKAAGIILTISVLLSVTGSLVYIRKKRKGIPTTPVLPTREREIFLKFQEYVSQKLSDEIIVKNIEAHLGMGYSSIYKIVKSQSDKSIKDYLMDSRMAKARELLVTTTLNITEVMQQSGFNDSANFSKAFKKLTGKSPRQYREDLKKS